jgi:hypothetical protein
MGGRAAAARPWTVVQRQVDAPAPVAGDRTAQLQLIADRKLAGPMRRDLPVVDALHPQRRSTSSGAEAIDYERCVWKPSYGART